MRRPAAHPQKSCAAGCSPGSPVRVFQSPRGTWIVDFGQNIAGWVKINVKEQKGQLIEITTTEALTKNGKDIFPGSTDGGANGMRQVFKY